MSQKPENSTDGSTSPVAYGVNGSRGRIVPVYKRLSFRLAILTAIALLGAQFLYWNYADRIFGLFGVPDPAEVMHLTGELQYDPLDLGHDLLVDARQEGDGRWIPDADALADVKAMLDDFGDRFAWFDEDGKVIVMSDDLPATVGEVWPFSLESHSDITLEEKSGKQAHAVYIPISKDSTFAGTLGLFIDDEGFVGHAAVDAAAPADPEQDRVEAIVTLIYYAPYAILSLIAVLLAYAISRLVTRRLTRLSQMASTPVGKDGELPGPFDDSGRDEIALLAGAMNSMRSRVTELVDGLAERDVKRREWVAQVSHDLRTPLTALMACLDRAELILQDGEDRDVRAEMAKLLEVARMDADRVQALSDDLLEIARLDANDELYREPVPPGELVRQAVQELGPIADARGIKLEASVGSSLPIVDADGRRLMRAMENLLRNAIQHAKKKVRVLVALADEGLRFEVRDDGIGLPEQDGRVVLNELAGRRKKSDSAGLGLLVTEKVAKAHGGGIGAYNLDTGGAAVWFSLPVPDEA